MNLILIYEEHTHNRQAYLNVHRLSPFQFRYMPLSLKLAQKTVKRHLE